VSSFRRKPHFVTKIRHNKFTLIQYRISEFLKTFVQLAQQSFVLKVSKLTFIDPPPSLNIQTEMLKSRTILALLKSNSISLQYPPPPFMDVWEKEKAKFGFLAGPETYRRLSWTHISSTELTKHILILGLVP
jgi:hypothetical protein